MKTNQLLLSLFALLLFAKIQAQAPLGIPYQAAARKANGQALTNTAIKVRFSILDSTATGTVAFKEQHTTTTNALGMFNLNLGMGTASVGALSDVNWGNNAKFLKVELDTSATGNNYMLMGVQQLMSVPYAIYSKSAETSESAKNGLPNNTPYGRIALYNCNNVLQYTPCLPLVISSTRPTSITGNQAVYGGNVINDGGASAIERGVCYSTSPNPTISLGIKNVKGSGLGIFTNNLSGLTSNLKYYIRAYATNEAGTSYSVQDSFTTLAVILPTISTASITSIASSTATGGGNVLSDGNGTITRGICWSINSNPTIALNTKTSDGNGMGNFVSSMSNLIANTTYYVRAYATNEAGTVYGNQTTFTTTSHFIGESCLGGIVVYLFQPGDTGYVAGIQHGIIAGSELTDGYDWGSAIVATDTLVGRGKYNTLQIISSGGQYAASVCADLVQSGYDDWYLPSYYELKAISAYQSANTLTGNYFGRGPYWSSSDLGNSGEALRMSFDWWNPSFGMYMSNYHTELYMKIATYNIERQTFILPIRYF